MRGVLDWYKGAPFRFPFNKYIAWCHIAQFSSDLCSPFQTLILHSTSYKL